MRLSHLFHALQSPDLPEVDGDAAGLDLAASAYDFSKKAREVVDDKLTFSATLMRAGEVDAAHALLAEVEADVRSHEAALLEQVNEVRVKAAVRREGMSRLRLARALAVAVLSSGLLSVSVMGVAVASWLENRTEGRDRAAEARHAGARAQNRAERRAAEKRGGPFALHSGSAARTVSFDGMTLSLTPAQYATYQQLVAENGADSFEVEVFLLQILPNDVGDVLGDAVATADEVESGAAAQVATAVELAEKAASEHKAEASNEDEAAASEPAEDDNDNENETDTDHEGDIDEDQTGSGGGGGGPEGAKIEDLPVLGED